jgi:hypothetical protein
MGGRGRSRHHSGHRHRRHDRRHRGVRRVASAQGAT